MRTPGKSKRKNSRKNSGTSSQGQGALSQKPPTDSPSVDSSTTEDVPAAEELEAEIPGTEVPMSAQSVSDFMNGAFDATEPTDMHDDAVPDDAVTESMFNMTTKSGPSYDAYSDITTTVEEQSLGATPTAISESLFENTFATEKPNDEPSSPSIFTKLVEDFQSGISAIMSDSAFPAGEEEVMQTPVSQPQLASDTGLTTPFGLTGTKVVDDVVAKVSSDDGPGEERDGVAIALANEYAQEMLDDSVNSEDVNNSSTVTEIVSSQPKANYSKGHSNIKSQITSHLAKTIGGGGGGSPPRTVSALGSTSTPVAVSNTESAPTPASIDSERPRRKGGRIVAPNKAPKVVTKASRSRNTSIESLNGSASMEKPVVEEFSALSPASHGYSVNSGGATSVETDDNANAVTYNSRNSGMKSSSSAPTLSVQFHGNHRKVDGYDRIPDVPHNTPMKQSEPSPRRSPAVSNSHTPRGNRTPRKDTELLANTEYLMEDLMMIRPEAAEVPLALEHPDSPRRDWAQELREPQPMPALSSQVSPRVSSRRSPRAARQTVAAETETTPEPDTYSPSRAPSSSPLSASASASDTGLKRSGSAGSPAKRKPKGPLVSDPDFPALNSGIKPGVWPTSLSCVSKGGGMWSPEALVSPHFGLSGIKGPNLRHTSIYGELSMHDLSRDLGATGRSHSRSHRRHSEGSYQRQPATPNRSPFSASQRTVSRRQTLHTSYMPAATTPAPHKVSFMQSPAALSSSGSSTTSSLTDMSTVFRSPAVRYEMTQNNSNVFNVKTLRWQRAGELSNKYNQRWQATADLRIAEKINACFYGNEDGDDDD